MNKSVQFFTCLLFLTNILNAQFPDNTWLLGHSSTGAPIEDSFGISTLTFYDNKLVVGPEFNLNYQMEINNTSISDAAGELLFYFNGRQVNNKDHELMVNGDEMYLGTLELGYDTPQGALLLPVPDTDNQYMIINTHVNYDEEIQRVPGEILFYSIIDLSENKGSGEVLIKNEILVDGERLPFGQLTACRHANGRDWWIIWPYWDSNRFMRFQVKPEGIVRESDIISSDTILSGLGQAHFTPDGSKLIFYNGVSTTIGTFIDIFDFDRCSGMISNQLKISLPVEGVTAGAAISHDSHFLYLINRGYIYQYDLLAPDIAATQDTVAVFDGALDPWFPASFFMGQLARDGKIYVSSPNGVLSLTVIEHPDRRGEACAVNQHAVRLPVYNAFGIPTFPNHRLGPLDGSPCDTLGINNFPLANFRTDQDTSDYLGFYFQDLSAYEPTHWAWDFGDGGMSQDTSPVHTYLQDGTYEVCLTVSNDNGSHTYCQTLQVGTVGIQSPVVEVEVQTFPNPFPDQFSVVLSDYYPQRAVVTYYTLAGQRIHQQRLFHGWNTVDGTHWPSGIYLYEVWDGGQQLASGKVVKG